MAPEIETIKGQLQLRLDEDAMEATLVFTPDPGGADWDLDSVQRLIQSQGLATNKDDLERIETGFKSFFGMDGGSRSVAILSGRPPTMTIDDQLDWKDQDIPEEFRPEAEEMLAVAPPPSVFETLITREQIEEIQQKKPRLPFLKPKEERAVRWIKKEEKIEVGIDPRPVATGYCETNQILGVITPGKAGKEGENLRGEVIEPAEPKKARVLLGQAAVLRGTEIQAERTGFYRRGPNWVDVLAYKEHTVRVYRSDDQATCLLDYNPGTGSPPAAAPILAQAVELGFKPTQIITAESVDALIAEATKTDAPLIGASLSVARDASFEVTVDSDGLTARLTLRKGSGEGRGLSLKEVGREINNRGFRGLDTALVQKDILEFYKGSATELVAYPLVQGRPAASGRDGEIAWHAEFIGSDRAEEIRRRLARAGSGSDFPAEEADRLAFVKKGQPVGEIRPPGPGQPGVDVLGQIITPEPGSEPRLADDGNLERKENTLLARRDGVLEIATTEAGSFARIRDYHEGDISVRISEDGMSAFISLLAGTGETVTVDKVRAVMQEKGVSHGIKEELLAQLVRKAAAGEEIPDTLIAEGKDAVNESGNKLHFNASVVMGRSFLVNESGGQKFVVKEGDEIARVLPPSRLAQDGYQVSGLPIAGRKAPPVQIRLGDNVKTETGQDGQTRYVAQAGGEVFYDGSFLEIKDTLTLNGDVDDHTGHVQFVGSVQIKGSVTDGYKVVAGGDLAIDQMVGRALVSSEGSVSIGGGVRGSGKAVVRAKNSIRVSYVEDAMAMAVGEILIKSSCLRSQLTSNAKIRIESEKAKLVGGRIKTRYGLETQDLGSADGLGTLVSFGQDYLVEDQIDVEAREIEKLKNRILKIDGWLAKQKEGQDDKNGVQKVRNQKVKALKLMEHRSIRLFNLHERFEAHFQSSVVVRGTLHPGVVFESHGRKLSVDEKGSSIEVYFDEADGRIKTRGLTD